MNREFNTKILRRYYEETSNIIISVTVFDPLVVTIRISEKWCKLASVQKTMESKNAFICFLHSYELMNQKEKPDRLWYLQITDRRSDGCCPKSK